MPALRLLWRESMDEAWEQANLSLIFKFELQSKLKKKVLYLSVRVFSTVVLNVGFLKFLSQITNEKSFESWRNLKNNYCACHG